jgi:hypothetical protein
MLQELAEKLKRREAQRPAEAGADFQLVVKHLINNLIF